MANDTFSITVASDADYNALVAEVYFNKEFVCLLNEERGQRLFEIEIFPRKDGSKWQFPLADFEAAIVAAKESLLQLGWAESTESK